MCNDFNKTLLPFQSLCLDDLLIFKIILKLKKNSHMHIHCTYYCESYTAGACNTSALFQRITDRERSK